MGLWERGAHGVVACDGGWWRVEACGGVWGVWCVVGWGVWRQTCACSEVEALVQSSTTHIEQKCAVLAGSCGSVASW
jgi:hypothetical protein